MRALVLGAGEVGYHIASKLVQEKADVVLIDTDQKRLDWVAENLDIQTITGFGANPETLVKAGLEEADLLVAVTGSDETNILSCRIAQLLTKNRIKRLARIRASGYYDFLDDNKLHGEMGLDFIINPSQEAVENIMDFLDFPGACDVIDVAQGRMRLVGIRLPNRHNLLNKPLATLLPRNQGENTILIAAIYRRNELVIPKGDTVLQPNDMIYVPTSMETMALTRSFFGLDPEPIREVAIMGGGEVGYSLAKRLGKDPRNLKVKLIEQSAERCEYLSERLPKTMVLKGDGTDQDLLKEENISDCDAFIAVSTNDEKNLISCLVAKRSGVPHTITRVNRFSYAPLVAAIGLEAMISARVAAVSAVLRHIRKGRVISVATLAGEDAEIIEMQVTPNSPSAGKQLMDIKFPTGTLVCTLTKGDTVIVPKGNTIIEAGDILGIVAKTSATTKLAKFLGTK